jgi:hypothetical protein
MKPAALIILFLLTAMGGIGSYPAAAIDASDEPRITLSVTDQPLGDVLDALTDETGYLFTLNDRWDDYPISAVVHDLPLEQGLKRLLRSLNHTIIWEADNVVTIMIYGKVDPSGRDSAIAFPLPTKEEVEVYTPDEAIEAPPTDTSSPTQADEPTSDTQEGAPEAADQAPGADSGEEASMGASPARE